MAEDEAISPQTESRVSSRPARGYPTLHELNRSQLRSYIQGIITFFEADRRSRAIRMSYYLRDETPPAIESLTHEQIAGLTDIVFRVWSARSYNSLVALAEQTGTTTIMQKISLSHQRDHPRRPIPRPEELDDNRWMIVSAIAKNESLALPSFAIEYPRRIFEAMTSQRRVERRRERPINSL